MYTLRHNHSCTIHTTQGVLCLLYKYIESNNHSCTFYTISNPYSMYTIHVMCTPYRRSCTVYSPSSHTLCTMAITVFLQGIGIKGREMALSGMRKTVALLCRQVRYSLHTLRQTHNMTTVKEVAEQCRLRCSTILFIKSRTSHKACLKSAQFYQVKFFISFKYSLCIFFILRIKFSIITENFIEFLIFNTDCDTSTFFLGGGQLDPRPPVVFSDISFKILV